MAEIGDLLGKVISEVNRDGDESIVFKTTCGKQYKMWHRLDCCENVVIESIVGDLSYLVGHPVLLAESVSNSSETHVGSETWTFYKLATIKGYVDIRWHGESNGYYSEEVNFDEITD
jgi:hypothetical protein